MEVGRSQQLCEAQYEYTSTRPIVKVLHVAAIG